MYRHRRLLHRAYGFESYAKRSGLLPRHHCLDAACQRANQLQHDSDAHRGCHTGLTRKVKCDLPDTDWLDEFQSAVIPFR